MATYAHNSDWNPVELPQTWQNPSGGLICGLPALSDAELLVLGWYKVVYQDLLEGTYTWGTPYTDEQAGERIYPPGDPDLARYVREKTIGAVEARDARQSARRKRSAIKWGSSTDQLNYLLEQ